MFLRHTPIKSTISDINATKKQSEDAERFQDSLKRLYETALQSVQSGEQIVAFYKSGQVMIRVSKIQLAATVSALMLTGTDEDGRRLVIASYYKSMNVIFRRVPLGENEARTMIGFSTC